MKHSRRDEKYMSKPKVFRKTKVEMNLETLFKQYEKEKPDYYVYTVEYTVVWPGYCTVIKNYTP